MYPVPPALGGMQPAAVTYPGTVVNTVRETQGVPLQVVDYVGEHMYILRCKELERFAISLGVREGWFAKSRGSIARDNSSFEFQQSAEKISSLLLLSRRPKYPLSVLCIFTKGKWRLETASQSSDTPSVVPVP